jgi:hypothetical protein
MEGRIGAAEHDARTAVLDELVAFALGGGLRLYREAYNASIDAARRDDE